MIAFNTVVVVALRVYKSKIIGNKISILPRRERVTREKPLAWAFDLFIYRTR